MAIINVPTGNTTAFRNALINAVGGDIIEVEGGNYGFFEISSSLAKSSRVIIRSKNRANPANAQGGIRLSGSINNLTFDGINFRGNQVDADGYPAGGNAFYLLNPQNTIIRNCRFDWFFIHLAMSRSQNCIVEWNEFTRAMSDDMRFFQEHLNLIVRHNYCHSPNPNPDTWHVSDRHPDCMQFAVDSPSGQPSDTVLVEKNYLSTGNVYKHVIFTGNNRAVNESYALYGWKNFTFRNNWIEGAHLNGIGLTMHKNVQVYRNKIVQWPNAGYEGFTSNDQVVNPTINTYGTNEGDVYDNVLWIAPTTTGTVNNTALIFSNNTVIKNRTTMPPGWEDFKYGPYGYEADDYYVNFNNVDRLWFGSVEVDKMYYGSTQIYGDVFTATGGTVATVNISGTNYKVHTFTASGNFVVSAGTRDVEIFVVGGGGGGAAFYGGGGGGGGVVQQTVANIGAGTYAVVVGNGGAGGVTGSRAGGNGGLSSVLGFEATGGGGGGDGSADNTGANGKNGGSGGGGGAVGGAVVRPGGTGASGQGTAGGDGFGSATAANRNAGGGGGAGGAGVAGTSTKAGNGGPALTSSFDGSSKTYAAGGGGATGGSAAIKGLGGSGGGGDSNSGAAGGAGTTPGSGGGGCGGGSTLLGGAGAAGIVMIRYVA